MLSRFLDAFSDPATRHAMLVHFPVVLSLVALPFAVLAALGRPRGPMLWSAVALYMTLCATAGFAKLSGEEAEEGVEGALDEPGEQTLESHETLGEWVWILSGGVAVLMGLGFVPQATVRKVGPWAGVAGGLFVAGFIANVADYGGQLVYRHGAAGTAAVPGTLDMPASASDDPRVALFETQVRPILFEHCVRCHNPTRPRIAGGLDQTSIGTLLAGGHSGEPAIVPGKPDESLLIATMRHEVEDLEMPRGKDRLPDEQIDVVAQWIAQGAVWTGMPLPVGEGDEDEDD